MNPKLVDSVINTVLYEGFVLYPYRKRTKNAQRFAFGRVYPEPYSVSENGVQPCAMQTQCLIEGDASASLNITVRFLHPMARDIGALAAPLRKMPLVDTPDFFHVVPELEVEGERHESQQEAMERPFVLPDLTLRELCEEPKGIPFSYSAFRALEPILDAHKHVAGVIVRRQEAVEGVVELEGERVDDRTFRATIRVVNRTPIPSGLLDDAEEIGMRTFASTHVILHTPNARFISLIDPPEAYADAAASCQNFGTWPVLVGDAAKEERDTMISSPVILYDYPEPEKPDDRYDTGKMDHMILPRAKPARRPTKMDTVSINGIKVKQGDMVRVRPKKRPGAMDLALAGRIATVESIEQDAEDRTHLALVLEDSPGRDLGFPSREGPRVLYGTDEVEPLEGE